MGRDVSARTTGSAGERAAERFLVRRGWTIVARNWRGGGGEIDIAATRRGVLAICEVKTRGDAWALAEPLTAAQRARIGRAGAAFLAGRPALARHAVRFDLITVTRRRLGFRVRQIPAAYSVRGQW